MVSCECETTEDLWVCMHQNVSAQMIRHYGLGHAESMLLHPGHFTFDEWCEAMASLMRERAPA